MRPDLADGPEQLVLDLDGYEGPIDLLLALPVNRRSISLKFRSWPSPINTSTLSLGSASYASRSPPTTW